MRCDSCFACVQGTSSTEDDRSHVTAQDCNTQDNNDSNQLRMTSHASTSPSNADSHDKPQDIPYNGTQQYYSIVGSKASPHSGPSSAQQTAVLKPQLSEGISRGGPSTAGPNSRAFLPEVGQLYAQWQSEDFQDARLDQVGTGGNPQPASQGPSGLVLSSRLSHTSQVTDPKTRASGVSKLGKRSRHEVRSRLYLSYVF